MDPHDQTLVYSDAVPPPPPAEGLQPRPPLGDYDQRRHVTNRYCIVCDCPVHADRRGDWVCRGTARQAGCGSRGGTFKGERMYTTEVHRPYDGTPPAAA